MGIRRHLLVLTLFPFCASLLWQLQPSAFNLTKDKTDTCDFEESTCGVTYYQASDWFRGHEHKWIRWFRLQVTDFISSNFAEFFRFPPMVEWVRLSGSNVTNGWQAPLLDHTTKSADGYYMYLHPGINDGYSVSVLLQTKKYLSDQPQLCFHYWYQITGDATLMLAVVVRDGKKNEVKIIQPKTLRTGLTDRTAEWKESIHTLKVPVDQPFKIAIVASVRDLQQDSEVDTVAIDDIKVKGGSCRQTQPKSGIIKRRKI